MTWAALLLADPSPCLRLLVLRELLGRPEGDDEVRELIELRAKDPMVADLVASQQPDGAWERWMSSRAWGRCGRLLWRFRGWAIWDLVLTIRRSNVGPNVYSLISSLTAPGPCPRYGLAPWMGTWQKSRVKAIR